MSIVMNAYLPLAANFLSSSQILLVSSSCTAISLLVRCSALPLPDSSPSQDSLIASDNPFKINQSDTTISDDEVTKFSVAERLFKIVGNAKIPSKVKERSLHALGLMCCGERFPFAKQIVKGFLQMAKDVSIHDYVISLRILSFICIFDFFILE